MHKKMLIIFPQGKQLSYFAQSMDEDDLVYVVLQNKNMGQAMPDDERFIYLEKDTRKDIIQKMIPENVSVLCCHEEALYWAKLNGHDKWSYPFDRILLSHLTKQSFKAFVKAHGVPICEYGCSAEEVTMFPVVAKPSIGFGSICVKTINNEQELRTYIESYSSEISKSSIAKYSAKYFQGEDNHYIFESFVNGSFYRIPLLVNNGKVNWVFPVKGTERTARSNSDYHWTGFEYGETERQLSDAIKGFLQPVVDLYKARAGVFVAEVMIDDNGRMYLLEFSPRQTSSRISKLVKLGTGIDLENVAIDIFLSDITSMSDKEVDVKLIISREPDCGYSQELYEVLSEDVEYSVYGDVIRSIFLKKR